MKDELLPCPFCGTDDLEGSPFPEAYGGNWVIRCGNPDCGADIRHSKASAAIAAWNRRTPEAE